MDATTRLSPTAWLVNTQAKNERRISEDILRNGAPARTNRIRLRATATPMGLRCKVITFNQSRGSV